MGFGDFFLETKKGIGINLANLKDNIKREDYANNSKLQAIFDMFDTDETKDGILSTSNKQGKNELKSIFEQLATVDRNNDGVIDDTEANNFIQKFIPDKNITSKELFTFLTSLINADKNIAPNNNSQTNTKTEEDVRTGIIESLRADTDETLELLQKKNNGKISDFYDSMKEFFNSDTSSAKVMEAAVNQAQGAKYMEKAQAGNLTKGEYIKQNRERLKNMMTNRLYKKDKDGVDYIDKHRQELKMSRSEFETLMLATIERMTEDMDIAQIKEKMRQLPMTTESGDRYLLDSVKQNAITLYGKANQYGQTSVDSSVKYIKDTTRTALSSPDDDELLSFEEVFYYEQGINYSKEACEEYLNNKNELNMKLGAYNKSLQFKTEADNILKTKDAEKALNKLIELFENFYSNPLEPDLAYESLAKIVKENNLPINVTQDANGKILMSMATGSEDLLLSYVSDILDAESKIQEARLNGVFDGDPEEKISELQSKVETSHEKAYGNDFSSTLGKMMIEDNHTFIQRYAGATSMIGMGLMVVGGVLCVTPAAGFGVGMVGVGQGLAMTGIAAESALGFYEAATRELGAEDGEYEELTKHFIMNAGGFIVGYGAGKAGNIAFQKLINKKLADVLKINITQGNRTAALKQVFSNPEYLKSFIKAGGAKLSSDFLISWAGDLVMMGVLDTNDDWLSLLKANLMGIMVGTSGELSAIGKLGKKGRTFEALVKKEKEGRLSQAEAETLAKLRQDSDIQKAYDIKKEDADNSITSSVEDVQFFKEKETQVSRINVFKEQLNTEKVSYEIFTDKEGNTIIKIVASAERKDIASGVKFTYDCYKYDKDGNIIDFGENLSEKDFKSQFGKLKRTQIVDNSNGSNSGNVYISLPIPTVIRNKFNDMVKGIIKPNQLEQNETKLFSQYNRSLDDVMRSIHYVCQKYGYNYNSIVNTFMKDLDVNLKIFESEEALNQYIRICIQLYNTKDKYNLPIYNRPFYHFTKNYVDRSMVDTDLVKDIALLFATSPKLYNLFNRLTYVFEQGNMDKFSLKKMIKYLKEGYISPETLTICLDTGLINKGHMDLGNVVDAKITDNKLAIKAREKVLDTITRLSPEYKSMISELRKSLGKDIYRIKWDCLNLKGIDYAVIGAFIKDVKNLIHLKNIELTPENFYIKINGYGKNENWAKEMVDITEQTSRMINEGCSSDEALSYLATETRLLSLSGKFDEGRATSQGVLRAERDGYISDRNCE